jgi:hypothetical protein
MVRSSNSGGERISLSPQKPPDWFSDPPSLLFNRYQGSFLGIKQPEYEVNYLLPYSAAVKNKWNYTLLFLGA